MGHRSHYLALVSWSTIDRQRVGVPPAGLPDRLELALGENSREYPIKTHEPRSVGIGTPILEPPSGYIGDSWFIVSAADLRAFASAPPATIDVLVGEARQTYSLWKRADAALSAFVEDIPVELKGAAPVR